MYHPTFVRQLRELNVVAVAEDRYLELLGDVVALVRALEEHGHLIEGYQPGDVSHPIVTSRFELFALRRTPPTVYTPYADSPPVLAGPLCLVRCWGRW